MTLRDWPVIVACVIGLTLVLLVIWRGRRSPLAAPLALLVLNLTAWNFADDAWDATGQTVVAWHYLDDALSPMSMPLALGFALVFIGQRRQLRWVLALSWAVAVCTGLPALLALADPAGPLGEWARRFNQEPHGGWYPLNQVHLLVVGSLGLGLMIRYARRADPQERRRALGVLAALIVLAVMGYTALMPGPQLGLAGFILFTLILTVVVLQPGLPELSIPPKLILIPLFAATICVMSWLLVAKRFNGPAVVLLVVTVAVLVALVIVLGVQAQRAEAQRQLKELALLGRFTDQLAHNLKNPLAALKGAAEYLQEELRRGHDLAGQERVVDLLLGQVERLEKVVGDYRKLGPTQPSLVPVNLNSVVSVVLALQGFADGEKVRVRSELESSLPLIQGDPGMLEQSLGNLLRNAAEAMPEGGNVMVKTGWSDQNHVYVSVQDDGLGMDERTQERLAEKEFYTTKPGGSGNGLAYVRRVAETHGGAVRIDSRPGKGTTVTVALAAR
jgi:signal transduction histidine kinase